MQFFSIISDEGKIVGSEDGIVSYSSLKKDIIESKKTIKELSHGWSIKLIEEQNLLRLYIEKMNSLEEYFNTSSVKDVENMFDKNLTEEEEAIKKEYINEIEKRIANKLVEKL